jgi:magnesium chelatase subunit H
VFGNAEGAYGSNVNHLVESGRWRQRGRTRGTPTSAARASPTAARGRAGKALGALLAEHPRRTSTLAYQNLESVELGV